MDNIWKNNVYSLGEAMWHKKGFVGQLAESAKQVYERMTPVWFEQRPFTIMLNGIPYETEKHYGIVRIEDGKEVIIGKSAGKYQMTQPETYANLFDAYVGKPVETMGFLGTQAQKMFITWDLPQVDVHGDKVNMYGFLTAGFDGLYGEKLYQTSVRVVCANTWNMAVNESGGATYSSKHTAKDHEERLGIWMRYVTTQAEQNVKIYQSLFRTMEETPITVDDAFALFQHVYPKKGDLGSFHPDELREKDQSKIDLFNVSQENKVDLAMSLFNGAGIEITPTAWGGFNTITELENRFPSKKSITESVLVGDRRQIMENALSIFGNYAKTHQYVEVR